MITKEMIEKIAKLDPQYIISGSSAVMVYAGKEIRKCRDLDLHLSSYAAGEKIKKMLGSYVDISYDELFPYCEHNGIRVVILEYLTAYKVNRFREKMLPKDLCDLYVLFQFPMNDDYMVSCLHDKKSADIPDVEIPEGLFVPDSRIDKNNVYPFVSSKLMEAVKNASKS